MREQGRLEGVEAGKAEGIEAGRAEGLEVVNILNQRLIQDNRLDDLKRATVDAEFQKELLKEYNLQ